MAKRRLAITAALAAFAIALTGCSSSDSSADGFVGVILPDAASSNRWETADRGFLQAAFDAAGVKVDIQNANGDKAAFQTIADQMLSAGAKVLVMVNLDSESAKAVQDKAASQGVPTIDYECLDAAGKSTARIVYLNGSPTDNNATLFKAGYDSVLRPLIDSKAYTLVDDQAVPDWDNVKGGQIFEQQLSKAGGKLDAVVSANEGLGLAAVAVLKKNKLNGKVCVSGQDATVDGLRAILTGDLSNTVYKAIKAEAEATAELAIALLKGEEATTATGIVKDGDRDVPSVLLVPVKITKANVKDVIADGFQKKEDVCMGIEDLCTANGI
jgi:D-xylose transport system substrate-binding protein